MAKFFNGKLYLSPMEASNFLGVSYKTLQRWADQGFIPIERSSGQKQKKINLEIKFSLTGHRFYSVESIQNLATELSPSPAKKFSKTD